MDIQFNTYYSNDDLNARLRWLAEQHPTLAAVQSIGTSHAGRDIWLVTLTNQATGPDTDKPAFWVDGNIHATEVSGSMACLYTIKYLLDHYGADPQVTRLLDETALYIVPRINPDGAALALGTPPKFIRSGVRPYPYPDERDGLYPSDIDGNGRILTMRLPDPTGEWKVAEQDSRVMVKRGPDEFGGTYYRLFPEGLIRNYDGVTIKLAPNLEGLDFNRNFPAEWEPEGAQAGAGPFPTSEPEIRAIVQWITDHPAIGGAITFHTFAGAILRPYGTRPDDSMIPDDLWTFKIIGDRGTELTGYPNVSVFHDFKYHPKETIKGVFDDWLYDHFGVYAFTIELWDIVGRAGIKDRKFIDWSRSHPIEDDLKIMAWNDENLGGQGFVNWQPFEHPQLGPVEIGGWDTFVTWRNPPLKFLEEEVHKNALFVIAHASMAPRLAVHTLRVDRLGDDVYKVRLVLENTGFLPTQISARADERRAVRPVRVELDLPDGVTLVTGEQRTEVGQLQGRSNKMRSSVLYGGSATDNRARLEWVVQAPAGTTITLRAIAQRAGTIHRDVVLE